MFEFHVIHQSFIKNSQKCNAGFYVWGKRVHLKNQMPNKTLTYQYFATTTSPVALAFGTASTSTTPLG